MLYSYGLSSFYTNQVEDVKYIAKVISLNKTDIDAIDFLGKTIKLLFTGNQLNNQYINDGMWPVAGDFVLLDSEKPQYINKILTRKNLLSRSSYKHKKPQSIVANIDDVFICMSCDEYQFHYDKLKIMIINSLNSHIKTNVILTKVDLISTETLNKYIDKIKLDFINIHIYIVSIYKEKTFFLLEEYLTNKNFSVVLIGDSGVGKSSIINILMKKEVQKTQNVSAKNHEGKHTTTKKDIFLLPMGGSIIDTPGIRSFLLNDVDENNHHVIDKNNNLKKISELGKKCKFNNCTHTHEPKCNVKDAIKKKIITSAELEIYKNFIKK